jgi:hypothetical protein
MNEQWYATRNKRTDALEGVTDQYKQVNVTIKVTDDIHHWNTQVMLLSTVNILSRWCRNITLQTEDAPNLIRSHLKDGASIAEAVSRIAHNNDPHINFSVDERERKSDITIFIGPALQNEQPYINIGAQGWVSVCGYNQSLPLPAPTEEASENPLSAVFAACLANAEAFRWAVGIKAPAYAKWYSLLDCEVHDKPVQDDRPFSPDMNLHRVHVIGCGAIGSSFSYLLALTNWIGTLTLIDMDEKVELHNTSSSLLFNDVHTHQECVKTAVCKSHLAESYFTVKEFAGEYGTYGYDHADNEKSADLLLCFANDKDIWSTIQYLFPPVVMHATTSASWGIHVGRHIPLVDECIFCTFKDLMKTLYIPKCAEGEIPGNYPPQQTEEKPSAILPFLSPAAAILAMTSVYKLYRHEIIEDNTLQVNLSSADGTFVTDVSAPGNCPVCRDQSKRLYSMLNKNAFFSHLSSENKFNYQQHQL